MPETVEQAALPRATAGRKRTHETYITGVRQFLTWLKGQSPTGGLRRTPAQLRQVRRWHNRRVLEQSSDGPLRVKSHAVRSALGLSWQLVLALARGELSHDEARKRHLASRSNEGPLRLISADSVAMVLDVSSSILSLVWLAICIRREPKS